MVKAGEKYRHFKGGEYEVVGVARNCDDASQEVVVYRELSGSGKIWVRELGEFEGFKDGVKRFEFIGGSGVVVKVKRLKGHAVLPRYAHEGDAGMDVFSAEDYVVPAGKRQLVGTGLAFEIPVGMELQIRPRSGLALKKGISIVNSPGTLDSGYRGELGVILINHGEENFEVRVGDRIAQVVLNKFEVAEVEEVLELSESVRGESGFGSTGVNI